MKIYHYTIADRLVKILIDGYLKLTPEKKPLQEHEEKAVWFTTDEDWDNTAFYGYPKEVLDNAGRIRISVERGEMFYKAENQQHRLGDWESLVWSAMEVNTDYRKWVVCFHPVPIKRFVKIELWKDEKWIQIPYLAINGGS